MDRFTTTVGAGLAMISQFLYTYAEDAGHIVVRVWKIYFKTFRKKHKSIVDNASPPKTVFEMVKMGIGVFLVNYAIKEWKVYFGCVFILFCAIFFSFEKQFDHTGLNKIIVIELFRKRKENHTKQNEYTAKVNFPFFNGIIHSHQVINSFNSGIMRFLRAFLNLIAQTTVFLILLFGHVFVGLLILVELPFYWLFLGIEWWKGRLPTFVVPYAPVLTVLDEAARDEEDEVDTIGTTREEDVTELTNLLEDCRLALPNTITRSDLDAKMVEFSKRFCFIKCLKSSDKEAFIEKYLTVLNSEEAQLKYYQHGVIKVSTWLQIMREIDLQNRYCVYRDAYWGENTGSKDVSPTKVSYKSLLVEFGSDHICTVDLLIAHRHISRIYLFRPSNYVNVKQWFWDSIIGYGK
jgi:hypothetical protein